MIARDLRLPTSITSDGALGLVNAITAAFAKGHPDPMLVPQWRSPKAIRIRCWFHNMANIRAKLPAEGVEEFMAHVRAIRDAPTLQAGQALAASVIDRFGSIYPAAVACLVDDLEASLAHLMLVGVGNRSSTRSHGGEQARR
jgi:transposase-like protein